MVATSGVSQAQPKVACEQDPLIQEDHRVGVIRVIEDVKEFGAELGGEPFLEGPVLEDGEVPIGEMGAVEKIRWPSCRTAREPAQS